MFVILKQKCQKLRRKQVSSLLDESFEKAYMTENTLSNGKSASVKGYYHWLLLARTLRLQ